MSKVKGPGTAEHPWELKTPPGTADYQAYRNDAAVLPAKGLRGRFGMYVPPVLEALGLAEVEHNPKEQPDAGG